MGTIEAKQSSKAPPACVSSLWTDQDCVRPDMAAPSDGLLEARAVGDTGDARALKRRRERAIEISQCMKELATAHGGPKRERDELRPTSCDLGPLNRADGSARYSSGRTEVLVAVWGPVESGVDENYGEASVEAQFRPISGLPGDRERQYEETIKSVVQSSLVLALHPRCTFSITVQVVEDDGAVLAVAINAIFLALLDAGAPLQRAFCAAACASKGSSLMADPLSAEEEDATGVTTVIFDASSMQVLASQAAGLMSASQYPQLIDACRMCCGRVVAFARAMSTRKLENASV